ncbi:MAG: DUF1761 domain-containing protein [Minisyncoccia bacterium]
MFENINELSVLVAAVVAAAVGSIWYSPLLFGTVWMKSIGFTMEEGEMPKREMMIASAKGVLAQIVFFFIIAGYISLCEGKDISLVTLGVSLTVLSGVFMIQSVIWERRPLAYFLVQIGYVALALFGGIAIIAYWPW